jgi:K+-sensing histidine kinase KdpD
MLLLGLSGLLLASTVHIREERLRAIGERETHLRELEQMRLRLITGITHELRTPLALILGPIERLREEIKDNPHIERFDILRWNRIRI